MDIDIKEIKTEQELEDVLELCYRILGEDHSELYGYGAWRKRLANGEPLVYGEKDGRIVSCYNRYDFPSGICVKARGMK